MNRSFTIGVIPPDEQRRRIISSIRQYRAACRMIYSAVSMAKMASASVQFRDEDIRIVPTANAEQELLTNVFGRNPQRTLAKNDFIPTALSFVWDSARRDVTSRWRAHDPEFGRATRGWLTLNGARDFARFNRIGIACPQAAASPKLDRHTLTIKWDHELGEIEFPIERLDSGRYFIWKSLRDAAAGWSIGTVYVNERSGRIFLTISYQRPDKSMQPDPSRVLSVTFSPETHAFLTLQGPDGAATHDTISAVEAIAWLSELKRIREYYESRRAAAGNPRRRWGSADQWRGVQERLTRNTQRREGGVQVRNHLWTRRIAERAEAWRCGVVAVAMPPETLGEHPWKWAQFRQFLDYKIGEIGGNVVDAQ